MSGHDYQVGESISAGMWVTPDADGVLFRAKAGDPGVGKRGVLEDVQPGDLVRFPEAGGGLGRKVRQPLRAIEGGKA